MIDETSVYYYIGYWFGDRLLIYEYNYQAKQYNSRNEALEDAVDLRNDGDLSGKFEILKREVYSGDEANPTWT